MSALEEFRVGWCKYPTNFNDGQVLFVRAASKDDARVHAIDHIERKFGLSRRDFGIETVTLPQPLPDGGVIK